MYLLLITVAALLTTSSGDFSYYVLEELLYILFRAPHPPLKVLELATWLEDDLLKSLTPRLLNGNPNTYAYTKCLTEQLVTDYAKKLPIAITRPSIGNLILFGANLFIYTYTY